MELNTLTPTGLKVSPFKRALNPTDAVSADATVCAWCYEDGVICYGADTPKGAVELVRGNRGELLERIYMTARIGLRDGSLLVPDMPEADDERNARIALKEWVNWCWQCEDGGLVWNHKLQVAL